MTTQAPPNPATLDHTQHPKWERYAVSRPVCGEGSVGSTALFPIQTRGARR